MKSCYRHQSHSCWMVIFQWTTDSTSSNADFKELFPQETLIGWWIFEFWRFHSRNIIVKQGTRTTLREIMYSQSKSFNHGWDILQVLQDSVQTQEYSQEQRQSVMSGPSLHLVLSQGIKKMAIFLEVQVHILALLV